MHGRYFPTGTFIKSTEVKYLIQMFSVAVFNPRTMFTPGNALLFFWGGGGISVFVVEQGLFSGGQVTSTELLETSSKRRYFIVNLSLLIGSNTHPTY